MRARQPAPPRPALLPAGASSRPARSPQLRAELRSCERAFATRMNAADLDSGVVELVLYVCGRGVKAGKARDAPRGAGLGIQQRTRGTSDQVVRLRSRRRLRSERHLQRITDRSAAAVPRTIADRANHSAAGRRAGNPSSPMRSLLPHPAGRSAVVRRGRSVHGLRLTRVSTAAWDS